MSEYLNVEQPFLQKLDQLGWEIIDHGPKGIPQDPKTSLRNNFKQVILPRVFKEKVRNLNRTPDGETWLTDRQLEELYAEVQDTMGMRLLEANKKIHELLLSNTTVDRNELTGVDNPTVRFIDFVNWDQNAFHAINQFRLMTPGGPRQGIIPDIVLFVNGLPLVVIECKNEDVADPISEALIQIQRYSNRREDRFGTQEGEERLFHYNLFSILTHGTEARFGSITADFDYHYNWKDIFPETYKVIPIEKGQEQKQEVLIHGMLNREILLDILRHFSLFMEVTSGKEVKIVCRYQQYRSVGKIIQRLRNGQNPIERSGVIWHTQGSGKSLSMVFLIRKLRSCEDLKDHKIILINDRRQLEDQLSKTASLSGETVHIIDKRRDLTKQLSGNASDLNMVMMHKFLEEQIRHSKALMKAYLEDEVVPEFKPFQEVNASDRILIMIDEAHRTQGGDMGTNLFTAFPQATRIAFTGTPLLTSRHKLKTHERFGSFIDQYKIRQSVEDRATLEIVYIGRTSKDQIVDPEEFHQEFEDVFAKQSEEERLEIQKRYGTMQAYLENIDRLTKIADDIVEHYVREILPGGFKAQVVASSIRAAVSYKLLIEKAIQRKLQAEQAKSDPDKDLLQKLPLLKAAAEVTKSDNNEEGYISQARSEAKQLKAIDNFKKDFDFDKPETCVAFLCVCDRLLTGFDAPVEQVMYLDKNLREHDLLQTIARVNRPKQKKSHGIVVDYFGVADHLKEALAIYTEDDEAELAEFFEYFKDINKEIPVLEARYMRLIHLFQDVGLKEIEAFANQNMQDKEVEFAFAERCIEEAKDLKFRAEFITYLKAFFDSLELLFNVSKAKQYWIPAKRFGYLLMRIRNRYRDPSMDLKWAAAKVRKLIDKHLESLGIDSKVEPVELLSDDFPKEVDKLKTFQAKASEMEHAIRRHIKVNLQNDPEYYTRIEQRIRAIVEQFQDHWERLYEEFSKLREEFKDGRKKEEGAIGLPAHQLPFYGIIRLHAFGSDISDRTDDRLDLYGKEEGQLQQVVIEIVEELQKVIDVTNFWGKEASIRKLRGNIEDHLEFSGVKEVAAKSEKIATEILALAKQRHLDLIRNK